MMVTRLQVFLIVLAAVGVVFGGPMLARAEMSGLQDRPGDPVEVYHIVIGPGPTATTTFGHNALRVRNTRTGSDTVFNWGAMEGGEVRNLLDLFSWKLDALLNPNPWRGWLDRYQEEDRTIVLQRLDLPPDRAAELVRAIRNEAAGDDRRYRYDIFDDNCTTRVRDRLDGALDGAIRRAAAGPSPLGSLRSHLHRVAGNSAPADLVFSLVACSLDKRIDRPINSRFDALYLPRDMMEILREIELENAAGGSQPLVAYEVTMHEGGASPPEGHSWLWSVCGFFVLVSLPAIIRGPAGRVWSGAGLVLWGLWAGLLGLALSITAAWALPGGRIDANLWYFTPFHLSLVPLGWKWGRDRLGDTGSRALGLLLSLSVGAALLRLVWAWGGQTAQPNAELGAFAVVVGSALVAAFQRTRKRT